MANTLTITQGASSITIKAPEYGYDAGIVMGLHYSRVWGGYKVGDDTLTYRYCSVPTWLLDPTDQLELSEFFNNLSKGRGENFTLGLGSGSGFFPFGPDKGDAGNFVCSLYQHTKSGPMFSPYRYHGNALVFYLVTAPAYVLPAVETEGTLSIGTVTTLRHPQTLPRSAHDQSVIRAVSRGGVVSSVDLGGTGDTYEGEIDLLMKRGNAAALLAYLTATGRGGDITVVSPANGYLFGIDNGSFGTYTTRLLTPTIILKHAAENKFTTSLRFWMKSNDTPS
jgi:hypothetical protein